MSARPRLALVGNRNADVSSHRSIEKFVPHLSVDVDWVSSETVTKTIGEYDGIWVIPGSPYADKQAVLLAIRLARETGIPYLGTCGGFQHALIEYGQSVLGFEDADDVQYDPAAKTPFIVPLSCSLIGETAPLHLAEGSRLAEVYEHAETTVETYHCRYGLNPDYTDAIVQSQLAISGWDAEKAPRAIELPDHPFFIATLYQPELSSTPESIHPLIKAFISAIESRAAAS
jgi:CTP synthase (UTP-ammonia lyase)